MLTPSETPERISFAEQLQETIQAMGEGEVKMITFEDDDTKCISFKQGATTIEFAFNKHGEAMLSIQAFEDVSEVISEKKLFSVTAKQ